jgi:hypothetical protein
LAGWNSSRFAVWGFVSGWSVSLASHGRRLTLGNVLAAITSSHAREHWLTAAAVAAAAVSSIQDIDNLISLPSLSSLHPSIVALFSFVRSFVRSAFPYSLTLMRPLDPESTRLKTQHRTQFTKTRTKEKSLLLVMMSSVCQQMRRHQIQMHCRGINSCPLLALLFWFLSTAGYAHTHTHTHTVYVCT